MTDLPELVANELVSLFSRFHDPALSSTKEVSILGSYGNETSFPKGVCGCNELKLELLLFKSGLVTSGNNITFLCFLSLYFLSQRLALGLQYPSGRPIVF